MQVLVRMLIIDFSDYVLQPKYIWSSFGRNKCMFDQPLLGRHAVRSCYYATNVLGYTPPRYSATTKYVARKFFLQEKPS